MKTTNLEISKKLKEIGFKADYDLIWCEHKKTKEIKMLSSDFDCYDYGHSYNTLAPSYDLETLIEAFRNKTFQISINKTGGALIDIRWINWQKFTISKDNDNRISQVVSSLENESLADTAGRLIIQLHEKGLISFGGKND